MPDLLNMKVENEVSLYMVEQSDLDKLESIADSLNGSQALDLAQIVDKARSLSVSVPGVM